MRTRILGESMSRLALVLAVLASSGSCVGRSNPGAPTPTPSMPTAITVGGTLSLQNPGDTGQLTATAAFRDGTTKDVTGAANWGYKCTLCGGSPGLVNINAGFVTARGYGSGEITVSYRGALQSVPVRVAPNGAFLVKGSVTDSGSSVFSVGEASVEAASALGTYSTTSDEYSGQFVLPGAGAVTLRVFKDGYEDAVRQLTVDHDNEVTVDLRRRDQPGNIEGLYTLTFTASPSCTLPPEIMHRTYAAQVHDGPAVHRPEDLVVWLDSNIFACWGCTPGFAGSVSGKTAKFEISDDIMADFAMMEQIDSRWLSYSGTAVGLVNDRSISATFDGTVKLGKGATTLAECRASDHQLTLTR